MQYFFNNRSLTNFTNSLLTCLAKLFFSCSQACIESPSKASHTREELFGSPLRTSFLSNSKEKVHWINFTFVIDKIDIFSYTRDVLKSGRLLSYRVLRVKGLSSCFFSFVSDSYSYRLCQWSCSRKLHLSTVVISMPLALHHQKSLTLT